MLVNAIKCPKCKDTVYSRAMHDFRDCSCGYCWIDGGTAYTRTGYGVEDPDEPIESLQIEVTSDLGELYQDWNKGLDKLGIIKELK
jgi:hypothetical protein